MRFGIDIAQQRLEWDEIVGRAQLADGLGFEGLFGFDHFGPMYGEGPGNCFEGWTMLAALSGVTERVRLSLLVTGLTYRHPSVLASEVVTVDHTSHGRVDFSLGAAWYEPEHITLGIPFPPVGERVSRLDEALTVIRKLWTEAGTSFDGEYFQLRDATLLPRPVQSPHPPIWIGANGPRMLRLVGKHADVWHSFGGADLLATMGEQVDEAARAVGRDPSEILRAGSLSLSQDVDGMRSDIEAMKAAGVGYLIASWPTEGAERVREFASAFLS